MTYEEFALTVADKGLRAAWNELMCKVGFDVQGYSHYRHNVELCQCSYIDVESCPCQCPDCDGESEVDDG